MVQPLTPLIRRANDVQNTFQPLLSPDQQDEQSLLATIGHTGLSAISKVGNLLDLPGSMVRDTLTLNNPFDQILSPLSDENRATGRDVLEQFGMRENKETGFVPFEDPGEFGRDVAGFAAEMALDPLAWWAGWASKGAGKLSGAAAARSTQTPIRRAVGSTFGTLDKIDPGQQIGRMLAGRYRTFRQPQRAALLDNKVRPFVQNILKNMDSTTGDVEGIAMNADEIVDAWDVVNEATARTWVDNNPGVKIDDWYGPKGNVWKDFVNTTWEDFAAKGLNKKSKNTMYSEADDIAGAGAADDADTLYQMPDELGGGRFSRLKPTQIKQEVAPVWYSKLSATIGEKVGGKVGMQQLKSTLKSAGVKDEEIEWANLGELFDGRKSVSKDELQAWVDENAVKVEDVWLTGDDIQHGKDGMYVSPGGENYRELLLTLPEGTTDEFVDGHWPEVKRPVVSLRMHDRVVPDGSRTLHLDEIQSTHHQKALKLGYKTKRRRDLSYDPNNLRMDDLRPVKLDNGWDIGDGRGDLEGELFASEEDAIGYINQWYATLNEDPSWNQGGLANAPFKKTYHELAIKRALRVAAEEGYDRLSINSGQTVINLEMGGVESGLKKFYDEVYPNALNKLVKKHGLRVEKNSVPIGGEYEANLISAWRQALSGLESGNFSDPVIASHLRLHNGDVDQAMTAAKDALSKLESQKVDSAHSIPITPELRQSLLSEPQALFQKAQAATDDAFVPPKGAVKFDPQTDAATVFAFQGADISTLFHETGHVFRRQLPNISPSLMRNAEKAYGVARGANWSVDQEEQFTEDFTAYLAEGLAPTKELQAVFGNFKNWMSEIYKSIRHDPEAVSPEVRSIFDGMLADADNVTETLARYSLGKKPSWEQGSAAKGKAAKGEAGVDGADQAQDAGGVAGGDAAQPGTGGAETLYQNVYHAGPHEWQPEPGFPNGRPRLDKMGTGEGIHKFGWGWYSAENMGVAKSYKSLGVDNLYKNLWENWNDELTDYDSFEEFISGMKSGDTPDFMSQKDVTFLSKLLEEDLLGFESAGQAIREIRRNPNWTSDFDASDELVSAFEDMGTMYTLDLPDTDIEKMLDWDTPMPRQSEHVLKAIESDPLMSSIMKARARYGDDFTPNVFMNDLEADVGELNNVGLREAKKLTAERLAGVGVPGNKYLDGISRGKGEGTRNYVVWDQEVLDRTAMLEKNQEKIRAIKQLSELSDQFGSARRIRRADPQAGNADTLFQPGKPRQNPNRPGETGKYRVKFKENNDSVIELRVPRQLDNARIIEELEMMSGGGVQPKEAFAQQRAAWLDKVKAGLSDDDKTELAEWMERNRNPYGADYLKDPSEKMNVDFRVNRNEHAETDIATVSLNANAIGKIPPEAYAEAIAEGLRKNPGVAADIVDVQRVLGAWKNSAFKAQTVEQLREMRDSLIPELEARGYQVKVSGETLRVTADIGTPIDSVFHAKSAELAKPLAIKAVRDFESVLGSDTADTLQVLIEDIAREKSTLEHSASVSTNYMELVGDKTAVAQRIRELKDHAGDILRPFGEDLGSAPDPSAYHVAEAIRYALGMKSKLGHPDAPNAAKSLRRARVTDANVDVWDDAAVKRTAGGKWELSEQERFLREGGAVGPQEVLFQPGKPIGAAAESAVGDQVRRFTGPSKEAASKVIAAARSKFRTWLNKYDVPHASPAELEADLDIMKREKAIHPDAVVVNQLSPVQLLARRAVAGLGGDLNFYGGTGQHGSSGISLRDGSNRVWVNADKPDGGLFDVFSHEMLHLMSNSDPDAFRQLTTNLLSHPEGKEILQAGLAKYPGKIPTGGKVEEAMAMLMGAAGENPEVWKLIAQDTSVAPYFQRIFDTVVKKLGKRLTSREQTALEQELFGFMFEQRDQMAKGATPESLAAKAARMKGDSAFVRNFAQAADRTAPYSPEKNLMQALGFRVDDAARNTAQAAIDIYDRIARSLTAQFNYKVMGRLISYNQDAAKDATEFSERIKSSYMEPVNAIQEIQSDLGLIGDLELNKAIRQAIETENYQVLPEAFQAPVAHLRQVLADVHSMSRSVGLKDQVLQDVIDYFPRTAEETIAAALREGAKKSSGSFESEMALVSNGRRADLFRGYLSGTEEFEAMVSDSRFHELIRGNRHEEAGDYLRASKNAQGTIDPRLPQRNNRGDYVIDEYVPEIDEAGEIIGYKDEFVRKTITQRELATKYESDALTREQLLGMSAEERMAHYQEPITYTPKEGSDETFQPFQLVTHNEDPSLPDKFAAVSKWVSDTGITDYIQKNGGIFRTNSLLDAQTYINNAAHRIGIAASIPKLMSRLIDDGLMMTRNPAAGIRRRGVTLSQFLKHDHYSHLDEGVITQAIMKQSKEVQKLVGDGVDGIEDLLKGYVVPEDIFNDLIQAGNASEMPRSLDGLAKLHNSFTALFKAGVLTAPARYTRDLTSAMVALWTRDRLNWGSFKSALNVQFRKDDAALTQVPALKDFALRNGLMQQGQDFTPKLATQSARAFFASLRRNSAQIFNDVDYDALTGVFNPNAAAEAMAETLPGTGHTSAASMGLDVLKNTFNLGNLNPKRWMDVEGVQYFTGDRAKKGMIRRKGQEGFEQLPLVEAGNILGKNFDEIPRMAGFIEGMKRGLPPEQAFDEINKLLLDYRPETFGPIERKFLKKIFPFYSFFSRQSLYLTHELINNPAGRLGQMIRVQRHGDNSAGEDGQYVPEHVRSEMAVPWSDSTDGGKTYLTGFGLMHEDPLSTIFGGLTDPQFGARELVSKANPLIKGIAEFGLGVSSFQGGPLGGRDLADMDPTLGRIFTQLGIQEEIPGNRAAPAFGSRTLEFALANSPLARALTSLRTALDDRKTGTQRAANLLSGFRFTTVSPEQSRSALREVTDAMARDSGARSFETFHMSEEFLDQFKDSNPEVYQKLQAITQLRSIWAKQNREKRKQEAAMSQQETPRIRRTGLGMLGAGA